MTTNLRLLGGFEHIVLLAIQRLPTATLGAIHREIIQRTERAYSIGAIYTALERLTRRGYVSSSVLHTEGGNSPRRVYTLDHAGSVALRATTEAISQMEVGLTAGTNNLPKGDPDGSTTHGLRHPTPRQAPTNAGVPA